MGMGIVMGIANSEPSATPGNVILRISFSYIKDNGLKDDWLWDMDFPVLVTNWKTAIAADLRARVTQQYGETIPNNQIMWCDFSRS